MGQGMGAQQPRDTVPYSRGYVLWAIGLVFVVSMLNVVDRTIVALLVPGIQADLGLSDIQLGLLLGPSFSVVHFLAVVPLAWLADRAVRRNVIAVGLFAWSLMTMLGGVAQNFFQLFATRMGVGIGEAAGSPPAVSLLSDTAPESQRARALSAVTIGALTGIGAGMLIGGYVSEHYGWRTALVVVGAPGIAVSFLVRLTLREPPRRQAANADPVTAARHLFRLPSFSWMAAATCLGGVGGLGRSLWEPTFLYRVYDFSGIEVGAWYFAINALPAAAGAYLGSTLSDRLSERDPRWALWICAIGNGAAFPFLAAFLLWPESHAVSVVGISVPVAFGFSALGSVFSGFFSPPAGAVAQSLARPDMRAMAHAFWTMLMTLVGMGLGPFLVGALSEYLGQDYGASSIRYALLIVSVTLPLSSLLFLRSARNLREDLARIEGEGKN